jgi:signal transduction histidine kinase
MRQFRLRTEAQAQMSIAMEINGQLNNVSAYMEKAREEERKRIAMEIHDELGQALTALNIEICLLKRPSCTRDEVLEAADEMLQMVEDMIVTVRSLANHMRPVALDYGITAALQWLVANFAKRNQIVTGLRLEGDDPDVSESQATSIFRIVQGSLTNISRHANATSAQVFLQNEKGRLVVSVTDDGRGFDVEASMATRSYGLLSMRERARLAGGDLSVSSQEGIGTTVRISIPQ